eukprot:scaffold2754_cov388-Prasinococcus_capsulatus_cf.AAC.1
MKPDGPSAAGGGGTDVCARTRARGAGRICCPRRLVAVAARDRIGSPSARRWTSPASHSPQRIAAAASAHTRQVSLVGVPPQRWRLGSAGRRKIAPGARGGAAGVSRQGCSVQKVGRDTPAEVDLGFLTGVWLPGSERRVLTSGSTRALEWEGPPVQLHTAHHAPTGAWGTPKDRSRSAA